MIDEGDICKEGEVHWTKYFTCKNNSVKNDEFAHKNSDTIIRLNNY